MYKTLYIMNNNEKLGEIAKPRPKEANENEKKLLENQNAILANSLLWLVNKKIRWNHSCWNSGKS